MAIELPLFEDSHSCDLSCISTGITVNIRERRSGYACESVSQMVSLSVLWGTLLGGSWIVISRVISPLIWVISIVTLLITLLITTHEPPSRLPLHPEGPARVGSSRELGVGLD